MQFLRHMYIKKLFGIYLKFKFNWVCLTGYVMIDLLCLYAIFVSWVFLIWGLIAFRVPCCFYIWSSLVQFPTEILLLLWLATG